MITLSPPAWRDRPNVILLMGPTATGKTALAIALAQAVDGEIVNADAMQCYRDLRILTARPTAEEEAAAPHHLFGFVDAAQRFSVGDWLAHATPTIERLRANGRTPIVVGGTGLAFKALTDGLALIPDPDPAVRRLLEERLKAEGAPSLHAELARGDPETAQRLDPADGVRIVRALEVLMSSGRSIRAFQAESTTPILSAGDYTAVALTPPRAPLYARIEARLDAMLAAGALDEAEALVGRGLDPLMPLMKAHGMPAFAAHLRGEIDRAEARIRAALDTRHYAKRQFTFIRGQFADWKHVESDDLPVRLRTVLGAHATGTDFP
jgi:tRNA dimethylallyltransferase